MNAENSYPLNFWVLRASDFSNMPPLLLCQPGTGSAEAQAPGPWAPSAASSCVGGDCQHHAGRQEGSLPQGHSTQGGRQGPAPRGRGGGPLECQVRTRMAVLRHGECPKKENARRDSKGQGELWASQGETVQEKDASELGCPLLHLEKASTKQKAGRAGGQADRKPVYGDRGKVSETTSVTKSAQAGQRV